MDILILDCVQADVSNRIKGILPRLFIDDWQSEPKNIKIMQYYVVFVWKNQPIELSTDLEPRLIVGCCILSMSDCEK